MNISSVLILVGFLVILASVGFFGYVQGAVFYTVAGVALIMWGLFLEKQTGMPFYTCPNQGKRSYSLPGAYFAAR